ncbi:hypothetical protein [Curtobacterium sp. 9128]|uniref:hypothetical protein n=1 Tax=Curtobacterium sp. 9128 TaxID=1793722 RepID=UPI0011A2E725|nr:hypothetical protein [Curtobacterium sp. 9128]
MERHHLLEPAVGWVPAPGLPSAPSGWRFWDVDRRALTGDPRSRVLLWSGLVLVAVGLAAVVLSVLSSRLGGLAAFGLVPVVGGAALAVTSSVRRAADREAVVRRIADLAQSSRAVEPAEAWGVPDARPFVAADGARPTSPGRRRDRAVVAATASVAVLATVVGASFAVVPLVQAVSGGTGSIVAGRPRADAPPPAPTVPSTPAPAPTARPAPSSIPVAGTPEQGTALEADCAVAAGRDGAPRCWAWTITAPAACEAAITVHFGPDQASPATRTMRRFVSLSPGVPLSLVLRGAEATATIDHPACVAAGAAPYPIWTGDSGAELPDADFPKGCDDWGCEGLVFDALSSCPAATIEVHVDDAAADRLSRDYAVVQAVVSSSSTSHNEVFVPAVDGREPADVSVASVTCED